MNKNKVRLNSHSLWLTVSSVGLLISPLFTVGANANMEISIDPYNSSDFQATPIEAQNTKSNSSLKNKPFPNDDYNSIEEVFIKGNPTPSRPTTLSGNLIRSNQTLPQIPTLGDPYRRPDAVNEITSNVSDNEDLGNNQPLSASSLNDTPLNQNLIVNTNNTPRSINVSRNQDSSNNNLSSSVKSNPPITTRRNLQDILVLSNPPQTTTENQSRNFSSPSSRNNLYRVLVKVNNSYQESQVKSLFPDAFRTNLTGESMLQVGLFSSSDKAEDVFNSLQSIGLKTQIIHR